MDSGNKEESYKSVPCDAVIANGSMKRKDGQPFVMYWKNRRNARLATAVRLRHGPSATVTMNTKTMSVVTDTEMLRKYYSPLDRNVSQRTKRRAKRIPKAMRYAKNIQIGVE